MRVRVLWTRFTASPRSERRGTMCRKYRTPTSGRAQDVLLAHTSVPTRSTKTSRQKAASYSPTNRKSCTQLAAFLIFREREMAARKVDLFGVGVRGGFLPITFLWWGVVFGGGKTSIVRSSRL